MTTTDRKHAGRRLVAAAATTVCVGLGVMTATTYGSSYTFPPAVPKAKCGPGARPGTSIQGGVPSADFTSGRYRRGYMCNTAQVSHIRLAVHQPANRAGEQKNDPGAFVPVQGYTAHYCSVPYRDNPKLVACSMNLSGLRVFDIRDLAHPKEAAYFNRLLVR